MAYEKLSFKKFQERLNEKVYENTAGARRAIGKSQWEESEKEAAHKKVNAYFGEQPKKKVAKKAAKKLVVKADKEPKQAARRGRPPKVKAVEAATQAPVAAPKRRGRPPKTQSAAPTEAQDNFVYVHRPAPDDGTTMRQNAAMGIISAYKNNGPLNPREQRCYDVATIEYAENMSQVARRITETAERGTPVPSPLKKTSAPAADEEEAPAQALPHLKFEELTPHEQEAYRQLEISAKGVPTVNAS